MEVATLLWHALAGAALIGVFAFALVARFENRQWRDVVFPFCFASDEESDKRIRMLAARCARVLSGLVARRWHRPHVVSFDVYAMKPRDVRVRCVTAILSLLDVDGVRGDCQFEKDGTVLSTAELHEILTRHNARANLHCTVRDGRSIVTLK